jgi:coenzyme F420-reducing hydrogenase gamma subunit
MKPRVAFFDFTSCEGCQFEVLNLEGQLLDVLAAVDIVNFREAISERDDNYEVAFVEGSISRESEIPRLKRIREQAKLLVALGACASMGGVNCLKNHMPMAEALRIVYRNDAKFYDTIPAQPISAVVPVDFHVRGCPINREEFLGVVTAILLNKKPHVLNYPVCVECKQNENVCAFEKGKFCLGPVTRAGCDAICINNGRSCWGCRGLVDDPNVYAEIEVLHRYGLTLAQSLERFRIFNSFSGVLK